MAKLVVVVGSESMLCGCVCVNVRASLRSSWRWRACWRTTPSGEARWSSSPSYETGTGQVPPSAFSFYTPTHGERKGADCCCGVCDGCSEDRELSRVVDGLVGRVNGRFGYCDYTPINYVKTALMVRGTRQSVPRITSTDISCLTLPLCVCLCVVNVVGGGGGAECLGRCEAGHVHQGGHQPGGYGVHRLPTGHTTRVYNTTHQTTNCTGRPALVKPLGCLTTVLMFDVCLCVCCLCSVLVYSEFAGCSTDFKGALIVNPYDADKVAETIHVALTMSSTAKQVHTHTHIYKTHETPEEGQGNGTLV